jgi:hypothetical protein
LASRITAGPKRCCSVSVTHAGWRRAALHVRAVELLHLLLDDRAELHEVTEQHGRPGRLRRREDHLGQGRRTRLVDENDVVRPREDRLVGTETRQRRGDQPGALDDLALRVAGETFVLLLDLPELLLHGGPAGVVGRHPRTQLLRTRVAGRPVLPLGQGLELRGVERADDGPLELGGLVPAGGFRVGGRSPGRPGRGERLLPERDLLPRVRDAGDQLRPFPLQGGDVRLGRRACVLRGTA